jgi:acetyl esterase
MTLDAATAAFVEQARGQMGLGEVSVEQARADMAALTQLFGPGPEVREVREEVVATHSGPLPVRVLVPSGAARGAIVYLHGGGWVLGSAAQWDTLTRTLADRTQCLVVVPDYRLAPEHPYPAALDDCWDALSWTVENRARLGVDGLPLMVAGDSAGANLAAALSLLARDAGSPDLAMQVLAYPPTDADFETASYRDSENQLILDRDSMIWFWDQYVPDPRDRVDPGAAPLRAEDLSGLPPAVIAIAQHDVVRDEIEAYAERLLSSGVEVRSRVFEGQMHGFVTLMNMLPGNADGIQYITEEIDRALAVPADQGVDQ